MMKLLTKDKCNRYIFLTKIIIKNAEEVRVNKGSDKRRIVKNTANCRTRTGQRVQKKPKMNVYL